MAYYFAWLNVYTSWLLIPAIPGLMVFIATEVMDIEGEVMEMSSNPAKVHMSSRSTLCDEPIN